MRYEWALAKSRRTHIPIGAYHEPELLAELICRNFYFSQHSRLSRVWNYYSKYLKFYAEIIQLN
jgi:hypothetical protein